MNNDEKAKLTTEQWQKLPIDLQQYVAGDTWINTLNAILLKYIPEGGPRADIKQEVLFVLLGLVHPDALTDTIMQSTGLPEDTVVEIILEIEDEILTPVRPTLVAFFENERAAAEEHMNVVEVGTMTTAETAGIAPANIPTEIPEEEKPLIPPIAPKVATTETTTPEAAPTVHPFEEKLRGAIPTTITPATPQAPVAPTPTTPALGALAHDPYREPIE